MSKAEIVQRLLEDNHITAQEAVILLSQDQVVVHRYSPNSTKNPYDPPYEITCENKEWW